MLSKQKIFNKAYAHALTMTYLAKYNLDSHIHVGCCYRTADGNRCLIGCFIPDEAYTPEMEGKTVMGLFCNNEIVFGDNSSGAELLFKLKLVPVTKLESLSKERYNFLEELQATHDMANTLEEMFGNLHDLAKTYKLKIPD